MVSNSVDYNKQKSPALKLNLNTFTHADGYSRHVEFAQSAQHQFFILYSKELSNILWTCVYV